MERKCAHKPGRVSSCRQDHEVSFEVIVYSHDVLAQGLNEESNNQTNELIQYLPALMNFLDVSTTCGFMERFAVIIVWANDAPLNGMGVVGR